jgi:hypothetical protein
MFTSMFIYGDSLDQQHCLSFLFFPKHICFCFCYLVAVADIQAKVSSVGGSLVVQREGVGLEAAVVGAASARPNGKRGGLLERPQIAAVHTPHHVLHLDHQIGQRVWPRARVQHPDPPALHHHIRTLPTPLRT